MIKLFLNEKEISFLEIKIEKNIDEFAGTFTAKILTPIEIGAPVKINIGKKCTLEGFVEISQRSLSSKGREYQIQGRERTGDLVDSYLESSKAFTDVPLAIISNEYTKDFGIKVNAPDVLVSYTPNPGSTIFKALSDLAVKTRLRAVTRGGEIYFEKISPTKEAIYCFKEGENILSAVSTQDCRERFKKYIGVSTTTKWSSETMSGNSLFDSDIKRNRVFIFLGDENLKEECHYQRD